MDIVFHGRNVQHHVWVCKSDELLCLPLSSVLCPLSSVLCPLSSVLCPVLGHQIVPRLYLVPESELGDECTTQGSLVTLKDLNYRMEPLVEDIPFQWAQAVFYITKLLSRWFVSWTLVPIALFHQIRSSFYTTLHHI